MPPAPPGALTTVHLKPLTWILGPETLEEQPRMASCLPCGRRPALRRHLRPHLRHPEPEPVCACAGALRGGGRMLFLSCCAVAAPSFSRALTVAHAPSDTRTRVHPCTYVTGSHSCSCTHAHQRRMTRAPQEPFAGSSPKEEPEHNSPQEPCPQPRTRAGSSFLP